MIESFDPSAANAPTTYNLLFVCTGNTCRSPIAAAITRAELERRGWTHVAVRSAGTSAIPGQSASSEAVAVLAEHGVQLRDHVTTPVTAALVQEADLILAMGPAHAATVTDLGGATKVALLTDFLDREDAGSPIDDPFGAGIDAYRRTYEQIERAVDGLLVRLEPILSP